MDSQLTGSNELLYVQTEKVSVTIKGKATHPNFQGIEHKNGDSSIKVHCVDDFQMTLRDGDVPRFSSRNGEISTGIYSIYPMFYEQQQYEIVIEAVDGHKVAFWHDNLNVRNKVTRASRNHEILSGVINFGNEIGFSDLVIQIDGVNYLRLVIEVFPTKIDYQNDYKQIVEDVTKEVYNVVFDFLKKTYLGYQQSEKVNSSPVEFFAVINKIYKDFIKAADTIMSQPHHVLDTTHQVLPSHKVKKTDGRTIRWIKKHPDQAKRVNGEIRIERALAVRKQVSYDTKENQLTKYILLSTARKLESFKKNYLKLQELRYGDIFHDIYDIDEKVKNVRIPRLILQPIVENALYHGIIPKGEEGDIYINAKQKEDKLVITVKDTGIGASEERISEVLSKKSQSFGLKSTLDRISKYYSNKVSYKISSEVGYYFEVEIYIPLEELKYE